MIKPSKTIVLPVVAAITITSLPLGSVQASLVPTTTVIEQSYNVPSQRDQVSAFIAREDVRQELQNMGLNPDEATARVAALSDQEISQIAAKIDEMPAGQDAVGAIVGAAIVIFVVLLITDLLCVTRVFNFTRCVTR